MLHRLLLLPLLSPLLAVLLLGAINPKPWVTVRVLTWSSPQWPLGGWIATAAALGAAASGAGTALALMPRRQVRSRANTDGDAAANTRTEAPPPEPSWAGPGRSAGEPAPTVSVPFRVIRKGSSPAPSAPRSEPATTAAPASDGSQDDWNSPISDDW